MFLSLLPRFALGGTKSVSINVVNANAIIFFLQTFRFLRYLIINLPQNLNSKWQNYSFYCFSCV